MKIYSKIKKFLGYHILKFLKKIHVHEKSLKSRPNIPAPGTRPPANFPERPIPAPGQKRVIPAPAPAPGQILIPVGCCSATH